MRVDALVAEIGSTTTVINAFDRLTSGEPVFLGQAMSPTTVDRGDVLVGLIQAISALESQLGERLDWDTMLACSSAAGGLRMTVHGLVYDMTAKAANEAALGAGAVVKMVTAGQLTGFDLNRIRQIAPNIVLLAGGVNHGEKDTAIFNARQLKTLDIDVPVVYAGNVACRDEIADILGPDVRIVDNVYPRIDQLNVEPARRAIQEVFEVHIVRAPGMSRVRDMVSGGLLPTPGAVMEAARVLSADIGDLLVVDVGGATTDVHSVTAGSEEISRILVAPEPEAKRTVEGDLGVYVNAGSLVERLGERALSRELGFPVREVLAGLSGIPANEHEEKLVSRLTAEAVAVAVGRHAGRLRHLYGPSGRLTVAEGKDLTQVRWIVGTGGALTRLEGGRAILQRLLSGDAPLSLLPREAAVALDERYVMAATGVLSRQYPEAALRLMAGSLGIDGGVGTRGHIP